MVAQYHFLTELTLEGDPERIWRTLTDVASWPTWWSWLKRVEVVREAQGPDGVGAIYRNVVRAPAGYGLTYDTEITSIDRLRRIALDSRGDLVGRGVFDLHPLSDGKHFLGFTWMVGTPKAWMSALAPIARPAFSWNHDHMMSAFGSGFAQASGARLVAIRNITVPPGSPGFQVEPPVIEGSDGGRTDPAASGADGEPADGESEQAAV